ncbi:hypothetical protein T440DRAFT_529985 [Plenodomus tracheiphilus IPT5]|uniref:Uncharacterized protein n=1 Tax=Plenodomus tracheiphilus IPT5 TaxID=1408161 RepID=A0A6A7B5F2_9PLEO|nr:hypothetical protein T440DRAFT_529985 [Plenodomus tracheiphilus IPT5]
MIPVNLNHVHNIEGMSAQGSLERTPSLQSRPTASFRTPNISSNASQISAPPPQRAMVPKNKLPSFDDRSQWPMCQFVSVATRGEKRRKPDSKENQHEILSSAFLSDPLVTSRPWQPSDLAPAPMDPSSGIKTSGEPVDIRVPVHNHLSPSGTDLYSITAMVASLRTVLAINISLPDELRTKVPRKTLHALIETLTQFSLADDTTSNNRKEVSRIFDRIALWATQLSIITTATCGNLSLGILKNLGQEVPLVRGGTTILYGVEGELLVLKSDKGFERNYATALGIHNS